MRDRTEVTGSRTAPLGYGPGLGRRGWRQRLWVDLPPLAVAIVVADLFFKFGRFSLEAVACLALWYALSLCWRRLVGLLDRQLGIEGH